MREERELQMRNLAHAQQQCKEGTEESKLHAKSLRVDAETDTEEEVNSHAPAIINESSWPGVEECVPRRTIVFDLGDCPELYGDDETGTEADDTEEEEDEEDDEGVDEEAKCEFSDADSITFAACPENCACTCCAPEVPAPRVNQGARRSRGCRPEAVAC